MPLYRKRPIVVEARQWHGGPNGAAAMLDWMHGEGAAARWVHVGNGDPDRQEWILIGTLEGEMRASPGDFIIQGVHGEFYACKPDIFMKTYEECD